MTDFIFPSDQDRSENEELNRVCEYLEEVLEDKNNLILALEILQQDVKRKMSERDDALEREAALANRLERIVSLNDGDIQFNIETLPELVRK